jgi:hypothetical protein
MATIRQIIISKLRPKIRDALTWSDIASQIGGLSAAQKAVLVTAVKANDPCAFGGRVLAIINSKIEADAAAEATTMLADGSLSADELTRIA